MLQGWAVLSGMSYESGTMPASSTTESGPGYEPGVLVRRQQREYPPELRQEIALAALEVGNNRGVARWVTTYALEPKQKKGNL